MRRSFSTRLGLLAVLAALAALFVSPIAGTASFTITPDGPAVRVTVSSSGGTSNATFSGTAGQRVSLNISNVTITSSKVSLLKPNGSNTLTPFTVTRTGYFMDVVTLPVDGTYKFLVDPKDTYTGHMDLQLYVVPPDPTSSITAGGAAVPATTTKPGQNALFTFNGLAGHKMSAQVTNVTLTGGNAKLRILKPDGTALGTAATFNNAGGFLEPRTLPADGAYKVQVDPKLLAVGSFTVQLFDVPADAAVALTVGGAAAPAATTVPGQNAAFTFTATAGVKYSVKLTESSFNSAKVSWLKPDNTALFSPALALSPDPLTTFLTPRTLTPAGTYKIFVNPALAETGTVKAQVFTVPPDLSGTITPGTPLHVATSAPGQNATYTFTGTLNHRMSLNLTNNTYESVKVSILKPDGTALFSPAFTLVGPSGFKDPVQLPASGTYKVKVDPVDAATGALDVGLYDTTANVSAPILANGTPTAIAVNSPGQNATLTFSGAANQRVAFRVSKGAVSSLKASLDKGTTHIFFPTSVNSDPQFFDTKSLGTSAGSFKIVLDPQGASTGSMTVTLWTVPADLTPTLSPGSNSATLTTGQNARLTFTATAGQTATVTFSSGTIPGAWARILATNGTTPLESKFWDPSITNDPVTETLTQSGTYTFLLDPVGENTGGMTFTFSLS